VGGSRPSVSVSRLATAPAPPTPSPVPLHTHTWNCSMFVSRQALRMEISCAKSASLIDLSTWSLLACG
jgi:hypothetical protein